MDYEQKQSWESAIYKEAAFQKDNLALATILGSIGTYYYKYLHDHVKSFE